MTVTMAQTVGSNLLEIGLSGAITIDDLEAVAKQIGRMLHEHRQLRLLISVNRLGAFTANWGDIPHATKRFSLVERVAMVGDNCWRAEMEAFCQAFARAKVKFFEASRAADARAWAAETNE